MATCSNAHLQPWEVQVEAQVVEAAADEAALAVAPPDAGQAGGSACSSARLEERGEAAAAVLQGEVPARQPAAVLAEALPQPRRLRVIRRALRAPSFASSPSLIHVFPAKEGKVLLHTS